ncbi:MAG: thiosulfate oxidation carrier protein SoxY [Burkholderiaceae bacterium]
MWWLTATRFSMLDFAPVKALPMLAFRIRMEQASPVRAMVKTRCGRWHVGSTWVQAAGGGCTVPGATRADGSRSRTLNQVQTRFFNTRDRRQQASLRCASCTPWTPAWQGTPAFYIEDLNLRMAAARCGGA